jgi:hypothetical protein
MTLYKQISLALLLFLATAFAGTLYLVTASTRSVYEEQLASHVQDTATSLGLSLSPHMEPQDIPVLDSIISATYDRGDFLGIDLIAANGTTLVSKSRELAIPGVPGWFIRLLSLETPVAEALVMNGWKQGGYIRVTGNPAHAYARFWNSTINSLQLYLATTSLLLLIAVLAVRMLLRPLHALKLQADAICENPRTAQCSHRHEPACR